MVPGIARTHLFALLEGHGYPRSLFPNPHHAGIVQVREFDGRHFAGLSEILQIELAAAAAGNINRGLERLHFGLVDRQLEFSAVAGFIPEAAFGSDVQCAGWNWSRFSASLRFGPAASGRSFGFGRRNRLRWRCVGLILFRWNRIGNLD